MSHERRTGVLERQNPTALFQITAENAAHQLDLDSELFEIFDNPVPLSAAETRLNPYPA